LKKEQELRKREGRNKERKRENGRKETERERENEREGDRRNKDREREIEKLRYYMKEIEKDKLKWIGKEKKTERL
jgi:hypothetical protein